MHTWLPDIKILNLTCLKTFINIVCALPPKTSLLSPNIPPNYMFESFNENLGWANKPVVKVTNYVSCITNQNFNLPWEIFETHFPIC